MSAGAYSHLALCAIVFVACTLDPEVWGEAKKTLCTHSSLNLSSLNLVRHTELLVVFMGAFYGHRFQKWRVQRKK